MIDGQCISQLGTDIFTADVEKLLLFYQDVFDAEVTYQYLLKDTKIAAAELKLAGSRVRVVRTGKSITQDCHTRFNVYVPDAEATLRCALMHGAKLVSLLGTNVCKPTVYLATGDRVGRFVDPAGFQWEIRSWIETVTAREAMRRIQTERLKS